MEKVINFNVSDILDSMTSDDLEDRGMSWEYCFDFFQDKVLCNKEYDKQYASLMLGFYLASWGMYRGSSQLLQRYTYTIHDNAIKIILNNRNDIKECYYQLYQYYESKKLVSVF